MDSFLRVATGVLIAHLLLEGHLLLLVNAFLNEGDGGLFGYANDQLSTIKERLTELWGAINE